jgi:hypothetical protein
MEQLCVYGQDQGDRVVSHEHRQRIAVHRIANLPKKEVEMLVRAKNVPAFFQKNFLMTAKDYTLKQKIYYG